MNNIFKLSDTLTFNLGRGDNQDKNYASYQCLRDHPAVICFACAVIDSMVQLS